MPGASPWLAVDPTSDRVTHARALRKVHDGFIAGEDVGSSVRAVVAQSWERSGQAGIDPVKHRAPIVLDEDAIADRWHRHPLFPILPVLRDLLSDATTQSGHMLVISDAEGVLLWIEGHRRVMEATEDMHFVTGADWSESGAGTNALGTAIAVDHPVQIFSAEHFSQIVHPWQCSGAPIHDPATGETLGVVDLTGHLKTAHPHTLALVGAAAGMAEAYLRHDQLRRQSTLRDRYRDRTASRSQSTALVSPDGAVLETSPSPWVRGTLDIPAGGGEIVLGDGSVALAEPLEATGAFVLWHQPRGRRVAAADAPPALRLELLRTHPEAIVGGRRIPLSRRHAEILLLLARSPRGLSAEQLAVTLYGDAGRPVSVRAELSRLRRRLGPLLAARPYRFTDTVQTDLAEVERALEAGDLSGALDGYREPLLPHSEVPHVVEIRDQLDGTLRRRILAGRDPFLINRWGATASGHEDEPAASLLLDLVGEDHPVRSEAAARLARLRRTFAGEDGEPAAW
jgi:hypothetical protein